MVCRIVDAAASQPGSDISEKYAFRPFGRRGVGSNEPRLRLEHDTRVRSRWRSASGRCCPGFTIGLSSTCPRGVSSAPYEARKNNAAARGIAMRICHPDNHLSMTHTRFRSRTSHVNALFRLQRRSTRPAHRTHAGWRSRNATREWDSQVVSVPVHGWRSYF
jgi:hypothetical protein